MSKGLAGVDLACASLFLSDRARLNGCVAEEHAGDAADDRADCGTGPWGNRRAGHCASLRASRCAAENSCRVWNLANRLVQGAHRFLGHRTADVLDRLPDAVVAVLIPATLQRFLEQELITGLVRANRGVLADFFFITGHDVKCRSDQSAGLLRTLDERLANASAGRFGRVYADAALVLVVIQHETGWRFWRGIAVENETRRRRRNGAIALIFFHLTGSHFWLSWFH